jgi:hypothetical protein
MSQAELNILERDVEIARAKFAEDLARLRDPGNLAALKDDLLEEAKQTKDQLVEKAKDAVYDGAQQLFTQLKEKAAANPAAALAIGAGLAWRIAHRPPIATALVGIGLVSLLRTNPQNAQPYMGIYDEDPSLQSRAKDMLSSASELAVSAKDRVREWTHDVRDSAQQTITAAQQTMQETMAQVSGKAGESVERISLAASEGAKRVADQATTVARKASTAVYDAVPSEEARDGLLLGVAALAVATAVGIAYQRRA